MSAPINRFTMLRGTLESLLDQLTNYPGEFGREVSLFCEDSAGLVEDLLGALNAAAERDFEAAMKRVAA